MILLETIHNAHQQLGRPTDHETLIRTQDELMDRVRDRSSEIEALLTKTWHRLHPEARGRLGGEPFEIIRRQSRNQAEEQIITERAEQEALLEPYRSACKSRLARWQY